MTSSTLSLIERAGLDPSGVGRHLAHGLEGADDGELFLEYRQSEALAFDNGRRVLSPRDRTTPTTHTYGLPSGSLR